MGAIAVAGNYTVPSVLKCSARSSFADNTKTIHNRLSMTPTYQIDLHAPVCVLQRKRKWNVSFYLQVQVFYKESNNDLKRIEKKC